MQTGPHNILGLEINEFAAELARVTVWIGDIQWCRRNGYPHAINPILKPLDGIEHRDALLTFTTNPRHSRESGNPEPGTPMDSRLRGNDEAQIVSEAIWPTADVIVGNPPFLGDKVMRSELGADYVETLRKTYDGRVPGGADLVTYWFEKARAQIEACKLQAAGLVSTNSIRGGANRKVLERIVETTRIFEAWSDEEWVNDGAAVRVSLIGFGPIFPVDRGNRLDGLEVGPIHADLTATAGVNLIHAKRLAENAKASFIGPQKNGPFDVSLEEAVQWLNLPNPHGLSNAKVVTPTWNGLDITRRPRDVWVIDFGTMSESQASLFETPFDYVTKNVKPERIKNRRQVRAENWWLFGEPAPKLNAALQDVSRYIATSAVSKHRIFVWLPSAVSPDKALVIIARSDDTTFGILHSRFHELWSLRLGTSLEDRPRYTPTTTFETFPFPAGLTPRDTLPSPPAPLPQAGEGCATVRERAAVAETIAAAARRLNELREAWLNPADWVDWVITPEEEKAGFPKRPVAKPGHEADLKKRTLTNLYNARPAWLAIAHKELDKAVAAAYGWTDYSAEMPDDEILRRLLALNLERAENAPK
jgi:type II restriction/modification system DNA methylase subunit YeeA